MQALRALDKAIAMLERWFVILCAGAISCILIAQVILRYGFSNPLFWAEEIATQTLVFMTFVGLSLLVYNRRLIQLDFIVSNLPAWPRRLVTVVSDIVVIAVLVVLVVYSIKWILLRETQLEVSATTGLPLWYTYAALPIAFVLMAFHYLVAALDAAFGPDPKGGKP